APILAAIYIVMWIITAAITRYSSLAGLLAAAITLLSSFAVFDDPAEMQLIGCVVWIVAFLFQRHRDNIDRLKSGTETKIGES
ncbi:MAG: glycerol-3-phosphate acyltransferase, partial [Pseudomonadota bacterium]